MTSIRCCNCNVEYSFALFKAIGSGRPAIVCPNCGLSHLVNFETGDWTPSDPIKEILLGTYYPNNLGTDGTNNAHFSSDLATPAKHANSPTITNWTKTTKFWVGIKVSCSNCTKTVSALTISLQTRKDGGTWYNIGADTGENSLDTIAVSSMNYTDSTPPNSAWWTANNTGLCSTDRADGLCANNSYQLTTPSLSAGERIELWFPIDASAGTGGSTYTFGIYDDQGIHGTAGSPGVLAVSVTLAAAVQRQFNSVLAAATSLPDTVDLPVVRPFASAPAAASVTDPIDFPVVRPFASTLAAASSVDPIDLVNMIQFASTLAAASVTDPIDLDITKQFNSTLAAATVTDPIDLPVVRPLTSAPAAATVTDPIDLAILVQFASTSAAASQTSAIDLVNLISFASTLATATATDPVDLDLLLSFVSTLAAATTTSDAVVLEVLRQFASTLAAATVVDPIDLEVEVKVQFNSVLAAATTTDPIDLAILRQFASTLAAATVVDPIDLDIAGLKQFASTLAAATIVAAVDFAVLRPFASTSAAASATSAIDLDKLLAFASTLAGATATSGIDLTRAIAFASTIAGITATSGIDVDVGAIAFFTTIVATTSTAGIDLWPEILGLILDPSIGSTSVIRTIDSLMIPERDYLIINRPATV